MPSQASTDAPDQCRACIARRSGTCGALGAGQLHALARHARHTHHVQGEELFGQDTPVTGYAHVIRGVIKLMKTLEDGRQQVVGLKFPGDFLGSLHGDRNTLAAEAACEVELCHVPRTATHGMLEESRAFERRLMGDILRDLDESREWMLTLGRKSAPERVASFLILIALHVTQQEPARTDAEYDLQLSRSDIADFLGLSMETVSRQLTELRRAGIVVITSKRHVRIPDLEALRARAG